MDILEYLKKLIQQYFEAGTDADDFYTESAILELITVNSGARLCCARKCAPHPCMRLSLDWEWIRL